MTTIVADHVDANVYDAALERHPYFSWGAVIAGAFAAGMVTFMLLAVGAGLGLMLAGPVNDPAPLKTILTAGGLYFFAVEAFGFAVGGYIAGRLCGPVLQSRDEEMFRSGVHGLVVWAVSAAACILFLVAGAAIAAGAASSAPAMLGMSVAHGHDSTEATPGVVSYWTDSLFRAPGSGAPALPSTAPVQAPPATRAPVDVTPAPAPAPAPAETPAAPAGNAAPSDNGGNANDDINSDLNNQSGDNNGDNNGDQDSNSPKANGGDEQSPPFSPSPAVYLSRLESAPALLIRAQYTTTTSADGSVSTVTRADPEQRAEVSRILMANALAPSDMRADDRAFIEQAIVSQTGISQAQAQQRLDALLSRIHEQRNKAAETARKAAAYMNIWLGLSLFFGLLVSTAAAVVARMEEEDKGEEAGSVRVAPVVTVPPPAGTTASRV